MGVSPLVTGRPAGHFNESPNNCETRETRKPINRRCFGSLRRRGFAVRCYHRLMTGRRSDVLLCGRGWEQLWLILGFLRRDIPIQQTTQNCPFRCRRHIPRGKAGADISRQGRGHRRRPFSVLCGMPPACTSCGSG